MQRLLECFQDVDAHTQTRRSLWGFGAAHGKKRWRVPSSGVLTAESTPADGGAVGWELHWQKQQRRLGLRVDRRWKLHPGLRMELEAHRSCFLLLDVYQERGGPGG